MTRIEPIGRFTAPAIALPVDNVDTDQIIPARYLKVTTRDDLGRGLFADWRYDAAGAPIPTFPLNEPSAAGAQVLVAGHNFGCGSSREHAPWALLAYGFRAVISTGFGDIFRSNALGNGLLPVALDATTHALLLEQVSAAPGVRLTVDLEACTVTLPDGTAAPFPIDAFARHCLRQGVDRLGYLLAADDDIRRHEAAHAAAPVTTDGAA